MTYNPDLHHRRSIRLKGYDYSSEGMYFITICLNNRQHLFGEIVKQNGIQKMQLNEMGMIAHNEWLRTSQMRPNIELDEFVIMPDHLHGIIVINPRDDMTYINRASTVEQFGKPTSNTIPTIIRGYKSSVTKQINILRNTPSVPVWQRNYYEHIIRDKKSYYNIVNYIANNPINWNNKVTISTNADHKELVDRIASSGV